MLPEATVMLAVTEVGLFFTEERMPAKVAVFSELLLTSCVSDTFTWISPRSVYLHAFVSRFSSICHSHSSSAITASHTSDSTENVIGTCLPYPLLYNISVHEK